MSKKCVLAMFGSFNPPTNGHAYLLSMARKRIEKEGYQVVKGFFIPTHGGYKEKSGLAEAHHRAAMCGLFNLGNNWIDVEPYETLQKTWSRVVVTLQHISEKFPDCRVFVVCGIDFVQRWNQPCWEEADCLKILHDYGIIIARRQESLDNLIEEVPYLQGEHKLDNFYEMNENILSEVSSTFVRGLLAEGAPINGLVPHEVINYIEQNGLYKPE
ncbi:hypothetical protein TVAG_110480 [Trichomonas vaginalis G3]|uniref:Nicotinamide-nucleotide adenylyltransferase n=1 Tax=Trichomonas vaginalis (strain ATCC PRA-98 / G3) TaxID=412133 RepID=A2DGP9_TRIV3|nr:nicotinate-nucleotide adenylyltransferase protein [Trichomonas vaginalis G3]EAY20436.1 hypothetical protein TVAG_110480 [Trichomonas vaginalis G3]KAI5490514.1 nicotinate-nucleotide adenylyltransferase protein [Trichomonas vaginalis G3]|eukprot:XP_001581422.1 hypothetical protein [Trichomonas vaginalis G3]